MKENKYELTDETIKVDGHTLHRIIALKDFGFITKGDLGGFIESEKNLSQDGDCWVYNDAQVYGNAIVRDNAHVYGDVEVYGDAQVYGNAQVYGDAIIHDEARIYDNACISGHARIHENAKVYGNIEVCDNAQVCDSVKIFGNAEVCGDIKIGGTAVIQEMADYMVFKNNWSSGRYFTWTRSNDMWKVGCFYGTGEELIKKAYKDSEESGKKYEETVNYVKKLNK